VRRDKALETAYTLTQRFRQMMRERAASTLDLWRVDGLASGMPELVHLASGCCMPPDAPVIEHGSCGRATF